MSTVAASPKPLDISGTHQVPMARLAKVEFRKALDTRAGRGVLALLRRTVDEGARTLVMVTHDPSAAAWADRVVFMSDGRLAGALDAPTAEQVAERLTHLGD